MPKAKNLPHDEDPRFQIWAYAFIARKSGAQKTYMGNIRVNPSSQNDWLHSKLDALANNSKNTVVRGIYKSGDYRFEIFWPKTSESRIF